MKRLFVSALVSVALASCASDDGGDPSTQPSFSTGAFEVPVGDSFTCFYTDVYSQTELSVNGALGEQGPGGHHILVYYADTPRPVGHHPCTNEEMVNLHQISGASGAGNLEVPLELRDGLALKIPPGKQFAIQAHYINTTDEPLMVEDTVTLRTMDPATVRAYVNYFVTNDQGFEIPAGAAYSHTSYCTVERDLDIAVSLGHMHEDGARYQLDVVDATGAVVRNLRDDAWQASFASHPPITYYSPDAPLHLAAGTRLRQICDWDNRTASPLLFPREMCLSFNYYFPGTGEDITCNTVAQ